jgi:1-acyl-sn-glycerol-3-phosphate acyltransferase
MMRRRPWWRFLQFICQGLCLLLFRLRVFGQRNVPLDGAVILACNHQSFLDPVLAAVGLRREFTFMARDTLFNQAGFRWLIESLNAFPVKRETADVGAIKGALRRLKGGEGLIAFPEGMRTPDGSIQGMAPGLFLIAQKARVPIVPTLIVGAFEAWPRGRKLPRPSPIIVAYDPPILPQEAAALADDELVALVRTRLLEMMRRYRALGQLRGRLATPVRTA